MKKICIASALIILLVCLSGCAAKPAEQSAVTEAPAATETPAPTQAPVLETEAPQVEAEYVEDFTVQCVDGSSFTLSEALKDHELALINLFFTGCGPCGREFPALQEAWQMNSDRIALIALTPDPADTEEVISAYAAELGLTFPMAQERGTGLIDRFVQAYPTSILVDKNLRVAAIEVGAKVETQEFLDWFESYTGDNYDPSACTYVVNCYGNFGYEDVAGVVINFCSDTACYQVTTDENGSAVFTGPAARYHVTIHSVPTEWEIDDTEWETEPYSQTFWIPCYPSFAE